MGPGIHRLSPVHLWCMRLAVVVAGEQLAVQAVQVSVVQVVVTVQVQHRQPEHTVLVEVEPVETPAAHITVAQDSQGL